MQKNPLPGGSVKKDGMGISMDRRKGGMGNLSVDTRRVTTENAPISHFCETRKDSQPVLADSSYYTCRSPVFQVFHPACPRKKRPLRPYIIKENTVRSLDFSPFGDILLPLPILRPKWRNGRRTRLKIWRQQWHEGSSPSFGTIFHPEAFRKSCM